MQKNTDITPDTSESMINTHTCYPHSLILKHTPSHDIMDEIGVTVDGASLNTVENLKFRIETKGLIKTSENDTDTVTNVTEYELKYPAAVHHAKRIVNLIRNHSDDISGFNPNHEDPESEALPEWTREFFDEGLIPETEDGTYCDTVTDIRIIFECNGNIIRIVPEKPMRILSSPLNGWTSFELEDFHAPLSYVDDVPVLMLQFIRDCMLNKQACVTFDCEGYDFTLVFTSSYDLYAITDENEPAKLYQFQTPWQEVFENIVCDIEDCIDLWSNFPVHINSKNAVKNEKRKILKLIERIRNIEKIVK